VYLETQAGCAEKKRCTQFPPGGFMVLAGTMVEKIEAAEWQDLRMPETLWVNRVKDFSLLIISIDTKGRNSVKENKKVFNDKKEQILERTNQRIRFVK
jgi:L(+)-tartrate dehydratase beta subunit